MDRTKYYHTLETVRRLIRRKAIQNLKNLLNRMHYADLAALLEDLSPEESDHVFANLSNDETRSSAIASMEPENAVDFLERLEKNNVVNLLRLVPPDDAAAILEKMPEDTSREYKNLVFSAKLDNIEDLLTYPEETAGRVMTQEVFALPADLNVKEAIDCIRSAERAEMVFYIYIVDSNRRLIGVVSLRKLLLSKGDSSLESIMIDDVISVTTDIDQEEVAHLVAKYDLLAIPVTDENRTLLGIITVDDVIDIIQEEAKEDMYLMAGSSTTEIAESSPLKMARIRLPWITIRFIGGCIAFLILFNLGRHLDRIFLMGAFIPLLMSVVGGIGSQASTIVAEQLTLRGDKLPRSKSLIGNELITSMIIGLILSLITGVIVFWSREFSFALIISMSIFSGIMCAALLGSLIPFAFHKLGHDPLIVTGSVISTILDLTGVGVYIGSVYIMIGFQ